MSQTRIAPSEKLAKAVDELVARVNQETDGSALLGQLAQLGAKKLIQEALEQEQAEHLARGRYERREESTPALYRTGYEPGRIMIGEGAVVVERPQVRGGSEPYRSRIWWAVAASGSSGWWWKCTPGGSRPATSRTYSAARTARCCCRRAR